MMAKDQVQAAVILPRDMYAEAKGKATTEGRSFSSAVKMLIIKWLMEE